MLNEPPEFQCLILTMHMCELCRFKSFYFDRLSWAHGQSKCRISRHNHLFLFGVIVWWFTLALAAIGDNLYTQIPIGHNV